MSTILFRLTLIVLPLSGWFQASSQKTFKGKVFDLTNSEPLPGALILSMPDSNFTVTGPAGQFELISDSFAGSLEISFLGYRTAILPKEDRNTVLHIGLTANAESFGEIVVKANHKSSALRNHAGAVSLISLSSQNLGNASSIEPVLNSIPGIYMHSGALNTNRITMRGIGSRSLFSTSKIRAYVNHIPLTNGIGETTLEDIDLSLLDRVEVVRGPSSSVYGAGLGGTIVLSMKKADYREVTVSSGLTTGSFKLLRNTHKANFSSEKGNLGFTYNRMYSGGYRENNSYNRNSVGLTGQLYTGLKGTFAIIANVIDLKAFIPSSIDSTTFTDNPRAAAFTWARTKGFEDYTKSLTGVSYDHRFNKSLRMAVSAFSSYFNSYEVRPFNILEEKSLSSGTRASFQFDKATDQLSISVIAGGELFFENYDWATLENIGGLGEAGPKLSDNQEKRRYYNLFTQASIEMHSGFQVSAGLNMNNTDYRLLDQFNSDSLNLSGDYSFEKVFSPRLTISRRFGDLHSAYVVVSHGFSPPSLEETLTPEGNINPDIQPEKGWNFEIGGKGYFFGKKLYCDIALFSMLIKDLLVSRRTGPDIFVGVNAGRTNHTGLEADLRFKILESDNQGFQHLTLSANYTYSHFRFTDFIDDENDYSGNKLTGIPDHVVNLDMDINTNNGFYSRIGFRYVSNMPLRDDNSVFSETFSLVNLKAGFRRVLLDRLEIDVNAGLNNIFNKKYASMVLVNAGSFGGNAPRYYYPGLPLNWYAGLSLSYTFRQ